VEVTGRLTGERTPAPEDVEAVAPDRWFRIRSVESVVAYALIAVVVLWRTWAALRWTFQGDDWVWVSGAARTPFLRFVTTSYNGHLQPLQFAMVWAATRFAPLNYALAIAPLLIFTALGGVLMWRFLGALFGTRPGNLIPLAVFMLCPLSLRAAFWLAGGLGVIPQQVFLIATLFATLLYVRKPSTRRLAAVGLAYAGALLVWEKSLLTLPVSVMFVLLYLGEGDGWPRIRSVVAGRWKLWAVLGGLSLPYAAWYVAVVNSPFAHPGTSHQVAQLIRTTVGSTLIPTYLGGPWNVSSASKAALYTLPLIGRLTTWLVFAGIVAASLVLRRQAWRAWALLVVYVGMCLALVASGRLGIIGSEIGLDTRYVADSVAVFAITLGLAFMLPLDRERSTGWRARRVAIRLRPTPSTRRRLAIALVILYAASAAITSLRISSLADSYSAKAWLATARSELSSHPHASILDGYLPGNALSAVLFPEAARDSAALGPIAPDVRWNGPDEHMLAFDGSGYLRPLTLAVVAGARRGPVPRCGYLAGPSPTAIPLERHLPAWAWGIRIGYFTNAPTHGFVTVDGDRQAVTFLRGVHSLMLIHQGRTTSVTIWTDGSRVCVADVEVGTAGSLPRPP
jgi:hypothetical protein